MIRARKKTNDAIDYATVEDFAAVFTENMDGLYRLAYLLTGDKQIAELAFVAGVENAVKDNKVFKEWAHSWAKRTIVQNAIAIIKPRPRWSNQGLRRSELPDIDKPLDNPTAQIELDAIVKLDDFERFVFVMSVLERYSTYEAALLLGVSRLQVELARTRALTQLGDASLAARNDATASAVQEQA